MNRHAPFRAGGLATFIAASLAVATAGCSSSGTSTLKVFAGHVKPSATWADYFGPTTVGYTCQRSTRRDAGDVAVTTTQTATVRASRRSGAGRSVALDVTTSSAGEGLDAGDEAPTTQQLAYVLRNDGRLATPPSRQSTAGTTAKLSGFIVYPAISDLVAGREGSGTISATVDMSGLGARLHSGQPTTLKLTMSYRVQAVAPADPIDTPAGTFTDALGVRFAIGKIASNLKGKDAKDIETFMGMFANAFGGTVWFARHVGIVEYDTTLGAVKLDGCSKQAGGAIHPVAARHTTRPSRAPAALCKALRGLQHLAALNDESDSASKTPWNEQRKKIAASAGPIRRAWDAVIDQLPAPLVPDGKLVRDYTERAVSAGATAKNEDEWLSRLTHDRDTGLTGFAASRIDDYSKVHCGFDPSATSDDAASS